MMDAVRRISPVRARGRDGSAADDLPALGPCYTWVVQPRSSTVYSTEATSLTIRSPVAMADTIHEIAVCADPQGSEHPPPQTPLTNPAHDLS